MTGYSSNIQKTIIGVNLYILGIINLHSSYISTAGFGGAYLLADGKRVATIKQVISWTISVLVFYCIYIEQWSAVVS